MRQEKARGIVSFLRIVESWYGRHNIVFLSLLKERSESILKALVTVELQLCSDLLISPGGMYRAENELGRMLRFCLVGGNAVVIEFADRREIQEALPALKARNICYPLPVWPIRSEITVEQVRIAVKSFSLFHISFSSNNRNRTMSCRRSAFTTCGTRWPLCTPQNFQQITYRNFLGMKA